MSGASTGTGTATSVNATNTASTTSAQDVRRTVSSASGNEFLNLMGASSSTGVSLGLVSGMFNQQQGQQQQQPSNSSGGSNDVLLNEGNTFPSIGNGYGNEGASGNNGSSTFDLSDFPSLGGTAASSSSGGNSNNTNGLAAILRQQQFLAAQQQMLSGGSGAAAVKSSNLYRLAMSSGSAGGGTGGSGGTNFHMAAEDFPALPGAPQTGLLPDSAGQNSNSFLTSDRSSQPGNNSQRTSNNYSTGLDGMTGLTTNPSGLTALQGTQQQAQPASSSSGQQHNLHTQQPLGRVISSTSAPNTATGAAGTALSGDYGLLGLLGVIRMSDADRNALALGSDLTTLGLNLNSSEHLYSTFAGPWSDTPTTREPQYQLPMCYYMQPPALKTGHLSKFQLETLFYIFYALPKDVLQAYAAQELYAREWKYHVDLKLWFKRASPADGVPVSTIQYIYFDINTWERRMFNSNMHQNITNGLLPEEDVRVKFTNS